MQTTIATRIQDLVGPDMDATLVASYHDIINDSFNYIAKTIPETSAIWNHTNVSEYLAETEGYAFPINLVNTTDGVDTAIMRKVLKVQAYYPGYGMLPGQNGTTFHGDNMYTNAIQLPLEDFTSGLNRNSIYYHGKSYNNPVWTLTQKGYVLISPDLRSGTKFLIQYFEYIIGTTLADSTEVQKDFGFPQEASQAGCIKASLGLLNARLSDAAHEEEDTELQNLLRTQVAILSEEWEKEMARLIGDLPSVGGNRPQ